MEWRTKFFVSMPYSGLGDRLYNLCSTMHLSNLYGIPYKLWWQVTDKCGCAFNDLFSNDIPQYNPNKLLNCFCHKDDNTIVTVIKNGARLNEEMLRWSDIIIFNGWNCANKVLDIGNEAKSLHINDEIMAKCNAFPVDLSGHIGVHFRRGDIVNNPRYASEDTMFKLIDSINMPIFLSSEDNIGVELFKNRYGDRVVVYPCTALNRCTTVGIQEALINIVLLSKCNQIIGCHSRFSLFANYLTGVKITTLRG